MIDSFVFRMKLDAVKNNYGGEEAVTLPVFCHFCHEPITKLSGLDSDSLCNHHISYVPEIITPAHRGCHTKYHNEKRDYIYVSISDRRKWLQSLDDVVVCYFCAEPILKLNGRDSDSFCAHHENGDHDDNRIENLKPTHYGCHTSYHHLGKEGMWGEENPFYGKQHTDESKEKMRVIKLGVKQSLEHRRNNSEANKGRVVTEETRRKIGNANTGEKNGMYGKHHSEEFKRQRSEDWMGEKNPMKSSRIAKKALETRRINDPDGKSYQTAWKTRRDLYGPTGTKSKVIG